MIDSMDSLKQRLAKASKRNEIEIEIANYEGVSGTLRERYNDYYIKRVTALKQQLIELDQKD